MAQQHTPLYLHVRTTVRFAFATIVMTAMCAGALGAVFAAGAVLGRIFP